MSLKTMQNRLMHLGGSSQQERMIHQKRRTFEDATKNSYQGAKVQEAGKSEVYSGLINPDMLTQNYDEKILSIGFESKFKTGTVFKWVNTNSYWMIYLQDLTELAYFKGRIRKCSHKISWKNDDGSIESAYISLVGPNEKNLQSLVKPNFTMDVPNYTIQLLVPQNQSTLAYFQRYKKFYLQGLNEFNPQRTICWQVEAVDAISSPGVIEIYASEDYSNPIEDDVENGIVDGLIIEPIETISDIEGQSIISPSQAYDYTYIGNESGQWEVISMNPVDIDIKDKTITIIWKKLYGGEILLKYGSTEKRIEVKPLF